MALGAIGIASVWLYLHVPCVAASPLDDVGYVLQHSRISDVPDVRESGDARLIVEGIGNAPAPESPFLHVRVDPVPRPGLLACDRDYSAPCPEHFVSAPSPGAGGSSVCVASTGYSGPCARELPTPSAWSITAKQRWSRQCQVFWPCKACARDFQAECPQGWKAQAGARRCSPPTAYSGPCACHLCVALADPTTRSPLSRASSARGSCPTSGRAQGRRRLFQFQRRNVGVLVQSMRRILALLDDDAVGAAPFQTAPRI